MAKNIACVIIAAGKGTRMKSRLPKVLHPICGRPMIEYVLDLVKDLKIGRTVVVIGHKHEEVRKHIPGGLSVAIQKRLLGTADAVKKAQPYLRNFKGTVLVLYADNPLLKAETVKKLLKQHKESGSKATLMTAKLEEPSGYGRIVRDKNNCICKIAEEKDADDFQKEIKEVNTGIACFDKDKLFSALAKVRPNNRKKEYYLTDIIEIFYKQGVIVQALKLKNIEDTLGINSQGELSKASGIMRKRIIKTHMDKGVRVVDPETAFIDWGVEIGTDTVIYPFTVIERGVKIGNLCSIGPFCRLRESTVIGDSVTAGNFLEIVRSKIDDSTLVKHFSYIGDAAVGKGVNIGAGTVVANFDGKKKNKTVIKDKAFIGSDTVLIAPVEIGRNAATGAGSVVTKKSKVADRVVVAGVPARELKKRK